MTALDFFSTLAPASPADTAKSLLAFFGTIAEWAPRAALNAHDPTPALEELVSAILTTVPAAWCPYSADLARPSQGYVTIPAPNRGPDAADMDHASCYAYTLSVHGIRQPAGYAEADPATAGRSTVLAATVAMLVGLASMATEEDEDDEQIMRVERPGRRSRAFL